LPLLKFQPSYIQLSARKHCKLHPGCRHCVSPTRTYWWRTRRETS